MRLESSSEVCALVTHLSGINAHSNPRDQGLLAALHRNAVYRVAADAFYHNERAFLVSKRAMGAELYAAVLDRRRWTAYSAAPTWIHIDDHPYIVANPQRGSINTDDSPLGAIVAAYSIRDVRRDSAPSIEEVDDTQEREEILKSAFPGYSEAQREDIGASCRRVTFIRVSIPNGRVAEAALALKQRIAQHAYRLPWNRHRRDST